MAEKDIILKTKLKQEGIFNFQDFYSFCYEWLSNEGYNINEKTYGEKIAGESKEIKIEWEAKKKISDYFTFIIKIGWQIFGLKSIEVQREGKKIKTNSGLVELKFSAVLVKDYESRWEDKPIWKFLRGVYDRYIIRSRVDQYEDKVADETNELIAEAKAYLALEGKN